MSPSLKTVERIFHEAMARPDSERQAFIEESCGGDQKLKCEVESLLKHGQERTTRLAADVPPVATELLKSAEERENLAGTNFGPYRIDRTIGEGGMGRVYLATDMRLGRQVAIKLVNKALAETPEARMRFLREAKSAAALAHANIAVVHDFAETDGTPWLVMEYVPGVSLRTKLLSTPITELELLDYAAQIASALEHAHARRIVHRDIKPENIIIRDDGVVKLVDFGLARAIDEDSGDAKPITQTHAFVGTLAYSAPELLSIGESSPGTDVYSLGVILFEMAYGQHPFANLNGPALVACILAGGRGIGKSLESSLSTGVRALIDRCMSRDPAARYQDGAAVAAAVRSIVTGGGAEKPVFQTPRLAILDFSNLGGASDLDWLGTGIAETLSADLARLKAVIVADRGRVQQAVRRIGNPQNDGGSAVPLGAELGVRWIVTGTYQRINNRVRITPRLLDANTGEVTSIEKVDGFWEEIFDLQDRIVGVLLRALAISFEVTGQQNILPAETRNLLAYEHYIRGRQQMYEMQSLGLGPAIRHFEKAIALDGDYALAYSGLGTAHALQSIRTSDPDDFNRASDYLERAIKLDPELGEPYPWLSNIRTRENDPVGSLAAGAKGVELQPDLPEAYYFFGGAHYRLAECPVADARRAPKIMADAIRLQPRFHPAWVMYGAVAIFVGRHEIAVQLLSEAIRLEMEPDILYRFVGARTLLGIAHTRRLEWDSARHYHFESLTALDSSDHLYRDTFRVLSSCGLGDIEVRCRNPATALTHYRRAWQITKEVPRTVGSARLIIRAGAGLASAYARTGQGDRARELLSEVMGRLEAVTGQIASITIESGMAQLCFDIAIAYLGLGDIDAAGALLERTRCAGWLDLPWLLADPELAPLHTHPAFLSFVETLGAAPQTEVPIPTRLQG